MAKRPPHLPAPNPGESRSQFLIIASLAILLLVAGIALVVYSARKPSPPPQVAQEPTSAYIPPPVNPTPTPPEQAPAVQPIPPPVQVPPATLPTPPAQPPVQPTPKPVPPPVVIPPVQPTPVPPPVAKPVPPPVVQRPAKPVQNPQMVLGNPSRATTGSGNANNLLLLKPYFAVSYNDSHGEPNWVSWHVWPEDIAGEAKRKASFDTDRTLPAGFIPVTTKDYASSGFDRGHMCPHSDRDATQESSYATFVMTNIIPQAPNNNQRAWAQLEEYGRGLVKDGVHLAIVAGPAGRGGEGKNGKADAIANGRVLVPAWTWKVIVVIPPGPGPDVNRITADCRVISVLMPNDQSIGQDWTPYLCTPADIEAKTGYTFFDTLSSKVAAALRVKKDNGGRP